MPLVIKACFIILV